MITMKSALKRLLKIITGVSLFIIILFFALLAMGLRPFILESTSMEPLYRDGSLVIVSTRLTPTDLKNNDVLVYRASNDMLVMHRFVGTDDNGLALIQGDRNQTQEHVDLNTRLVGKAVLQLPGVGKIVNVINSSPWIVWMIVIGLIILACIPTNAEPSAETLMCQPQNTLPQHCNHHNHCNPTQEDLTIGSNEKNYI